MIITRKLSLQYIASIHLHEHEKYMMAVSGKKQIKLQKTKLIIH